MITVETVKDTERFRALRSEWTALLDACSSNCVFVSWEWMFAWWLHLADGRQLNIVLVRRDGELIAIAPLALPSCGLLSLLPLCRLEFLASGTVGSDYLSLLIRHGHEDVALKQLADCLSKSGHVLEFARVEKSSLLMVNMALQLGQSGWQVRSQTTNHAPYIKLAGLDWDSYLGTLNRTHRSDVEKKTKKLQKVFAIDFSTANTEEERQLALQTFIDMHLQRWSTQGGSNAFDSRELVAFHHELSALALEKGWLRLHTLNLDGVAAASLYVFSYHGVCYYYQAAFNQEFSKYSVGMLMLAFCIRHALGEHLAEFDLLHDDEEYKYLWAHEERELIRLELFPPSIAGRVSRQAVLVKSALKRLLRTLQPIVQSGN